MSQSFLVDFENDHDAEDNDQSPDTGDLISKLPAPNTREADVVLGILYNG
jgi:hypothetical protein